MSTIAPPPKPANPVLVDSEGYIDQQIRRTRRSLKLLDLAAGTLTLLIGLLAFVLVGALIDHWIVPGGLSDGGRLALFGLMLAGVAWYGWRQFVPLLKPINPVYAAQTIERNTPTLKNSLLNLLLFRSHRDYLSARVYHALEQQTAVKLSSSEIDGSLDRSALLRLGYVLLGVIAVFALYAVLSPKSLALSTLRVINPLSEIAAPSRVQIQDVKPGKTSVARGERVEVSAEIHGLGADEPVRLRYSTADERTVDESIRMERSSPESRRFEASLPRGTDAGVEQDLTYWIEAGDARTRKFKLTVFTRPTLIVQKVHYAYPPYTGLPTKETNHIGDIRGVEGTKVTIGALASQKIKSAYVDFDADGTSDLQMKTDGDRAMVTFPLELRDDHRTPVHAKYVLRFTAEDGRQNVEPPVYTIEVTPDYAPEVSITEPQEPEQVARLNDVIPIGVEARDPDYGLKSVTIMGKVDGGKEQTLLEMIDEPQTGRVLATKLLTPGDAGLKPGDVLEYWAVATDTKPAPNVEGSKQHYFLKIIGPDKPQQGNPQQRPQQGAQQPNDDQQGGENGESGSSGVGGGQGSDSSEGGGEGEQQSGGGGSSGKGKQGESGQEGDQGQGGASGNGGGNESGDSKEKSDQPGENGGGSGNSEGEQSENDASQDGSQGNGGGASGQKQQPKDGQSPSDQGGESGEAGGKDSGEAGGQGGKVSSEGDEDATAMQRIMEQWNKNNPQQDGQGKPGDQQQGGEQQQGGDQQQGGKQTGEAGQAGQPGESKGEQQGAEGAQQQGAQDAQQQPNQNNNVSRDAAGERSPDDAPPNNQQQGVNGQEPKEGKAGEGQQTNGEQGKQPPGGSPQANNAAGQGQQGTGQQPQAEGAQPQGPGEQAGDQQQQGAGAGQNPSKREGANQSREAKPGDGEQEKQDGQQPSPDSAMNQSGGDSGAGHKTGKEQGAPGSDDANRQGTKKNQEDNRPGREDNEAPVGSPDKKESDSQGGLSGEQSGGGQEGGGQKADAPGKGGPGQHEPADEGAGRAQEQGEGQTGTQAGDQQKAEGQTGQSSGNQAGNGSQQGETGESKQQQPGKQGSEQGNNPNRNAAGERSPNDSSSPNNQSPADQQGQPGAEQQPPAGNEQGEQGDKQQPGSEAQGQQGEQGQQPGSRDAAGEHSPNDSSPNNQPPGDQQNNQQPGDKPSSQNAAGSAPPMGGGTGSAASSSSSAESGQLGADQANLNYAREQTNLVLEGLDQQLAKKQVDRELLKNLGWTEAELQRFVDRWKSLKERAAGQGEDAEDAKQELDDTLGSLGLRKDGPLRFKGQAKADDLRANDALRVKPPSEYADRVREYTKGISSQRKD